MKRRLTGAAVLAAMLLATAGAAVPAGAPEPFRVRMVTMNGTSGPAYYSHPTRSYRFVVMPPQGEIVAMAPAGAFSGSARAR